MRFIRKCYVFVPLLLLGVMVSAAYAAYCGTGLGLVTDYVNAVNAEAYAEDQRIAAGAAKVSAISYYNARCDLTDYYQDIMDEQDDDWYNHAAACGYCVYEECPSPYECYEGRWDYWVPFVNAVNDYNNAYSLETIAYNDMVAAINAYNTWVATEDAREQEVLDTYDAWILHRGVNSANCQECWDTYWGN